MNVSYKIKLRFKQTVTILLIGLIPLLFTSCTYNGEQNARLDAQDQLLREQQIKLDAAATQVAALTDSLGQTISSIVTLSAQIGLLAADENATEMQVAALEALITTLQNQATAMQASIVNLQLQEGVVAYLNPCGVNPGYNEVLMKTSSGKVIAFFESGGNRFLTILTQNTNYRTTDADQCYFHIDSNNNLAGEHH